MSMLTVQCYSRSHCRNVLLVVQHYSRSHCSNVLLTVQRFSCSHCSEVLTDSAALQLLPLQRSAC
jgi:hypothetical protein